MKCTQKILKVKNSLFSSSSDTCYSTFYNQVVRQCFTASYKNMKIILVLVQLLIAVERQLNRKKLIRYQIKDCYPIIQKAFVK